MIELKKVSKLRTTDLFIWANEETREFMCARPNGHGRRRLEVLQLRSPVDSRGYIEVKTYLHKEKDGLFGNDGLVYQGTDQVLVLNNQGGGIPVDPVCMSCGGSFVGGHRWSYDHNLYECDKHVDGAPTLYGKQIYLPDCHGAEDDFFESLGL